MVAIEDMVHVGQSIYAKDLALPVINTHLNMEVVHLVDDLEKIDEVVEKTNEDHGELEMVMALDVLVKTEVDVDYVTLPLLLVENVENDVPTNIVAQEV